VVSTQSGVRVGVALLPEVNPAVDDRWRTVETLGLAHAWCFDHLAWRGLADSDWYGTVPVLAAAALTTNRISLGTLVASPNFRHPVPFDVMSGGRLTLAIGAGAPGFDAEMLGGPLLSPAARHRRFEKFVTLLDVALGQPVTSWSGEFFSAVEACTVPPCLQQPRPPFVLAANGPRGMKLAASVAEGWVTMGTAQRDATPCDWWLGVADAARRFDDVDPPTDIRATWT
jgi:alkanesulfonate monooxygenase SsuD/methylene tetrahydromethanopterin reductase-like flavin-dependent oxidoreductase (luciferase family)